jgi:DNA-directed RNA polymerase I subunit RPA2
MTRKELIEHKEEENETGGYFIVNGIEKIIRLLVVPRRNDVMGIVRPSWTKISPEYTEYGTIIRAVREDQSSQTITLHYLSNGNATIRFILGKQEFFIPLVIVLKVTSFIHLSFVFFVIL